MNKTELISKISEDIELSKIRVNVILDSFFEEIKDSVENGDNVYLRGLGSFLLKEKKRAGTVKTIPHFKPGKKFVDQVRGFIE